MAGIYCLLNRRKFRSVFLLVPIDLEGASSTKVARGVWTLQMREMGPTKMFPGVKGEKSSSAYKKNPPLPKHHFPRASDERPKKKKTHLTLLKFGKFVLQDGLTVGESRPLNGQEKSSTSLKEGPEGV